MSYKILSTKYLILIYIFYTPFTFGWNFDGKINCATIYSGVNYTGEQLVIRKGEYFYDLNEAYLNTNLNKNTPEFQTWNNRTSSIEINSGCALNVWSSTYSEGDNTVITQENQTGVLDENWDNSISSLSCICATDCESNKCPYVRMKQGQCASAFIEKGCNTCNGIYVDLKPVNKTFIGNYHAKGSKIQSVFVKSGCQLITYEERDFEGDYSTYGAGIYEEFTSKIVSYNCTCNGSNSNDTIDPEELMERSINGPIMIEIPSTSENITTMLKGELGRHPGLMAALRSYKNGRSPRNAYILLLGMTGSGKSATINFLFDNVTIAAVGGTKSTTSQIHEYRIPVPIDELGIQNSELRVIDTPGLGDTRGMEIDAQFLATLDDYLDNHEDLKNRMPNIVMIFSKFNQNRFVGTGAGFVKMLRGLDSFAKRLFDKKYSNVIVVLSHYMSVTKNLQRNPSSRLKEFKDVVQDYSLFPKPVVITLAENKPEDQELPMVNGFYKFPNGDFYPRNLFEKIQQATTNGGDPIGEAITRNAFKEPEKFNVTQIDYPLVDLMHSKVSKYLSLLSLNNYKVEETEISSLLEKAYEDIPQKLKRTFPDTLPYLQRSLNIRNIASKSDIPKTSAKVVELLKELRQSDLVIELLEKALEIRVPKLDINLLIGQSYDLMHDTVLPSSPFATNSFKISDIGYLLPDTMTCKIEKSVANVYHYYDSDKEYYLARLHSLSADDGINVDKLSAKPKAGHNVVPAEISLVENSTNFENILSAVWEHRLFQLTLNDAALNFNKHFKDTVSTIPTFNSSDYESVDAWKKFFAQYGTHVVKSAYGGGAVEIIAKTLDDTTTTIEAKEAMGKTLFNLVQFTEDVSIGSNAEFKYDNSSDDNTKYSLIFRGGDYKFHTPDLERMGLSGASKLLDDWKDSLSLQPIMLQTQMKLVPISEMAKRISQEAYVKLVNAATAMFDASLIYKPPPPLPPPPPREDTKILEAMISSYNKQIENLMAELNSQRMASDQLMMDIQRERYEDNNRRDKENQELMKMIIEQNRRIADMPSCLKAGTKILMNGGHEQNIEDITSGDYVLNKDFKPVRVMAAVKWVLGDLKFYGFTKNNYFFTHTHLFVGPKDKLYAVSKDEHISVNPLMKYADMNDMDGTFEILKKIQTRDHYGISPVNSSVFDDPNIYPEDTPIYFLELDSQDGTYIANNYVSKHDLPDFSHWPNTISTLFTALSFPSVQTIKNCENNFENYDMLIKLVDYLTFNLETLIMENNEYGNITELSTDDFDIENSKFEQIFDNNLFLSFAVSLYSNSGELLAERLDNKYHEGHFIPKEILVNKIIGDIEKYLNYTKLCT